MKIRFRHRNQSRIQQNITAPREYTSEAFAALSRAQWDAVLAFIVEGGSAHRHIPFRTRIL